MTLNKKIINYVRTHGAGRGYTCVTLEHLIWGLQDTYPDEPRPTVGEVHRALTELTDGKTIIVRYWFGQISLRLSGARVEVEQE